MGRKKSIIAINGSASDASSNLKLIKEIQGLIGDEFEVIILDTLKFLPHFNPDLSVENTPNEVIEIRNLVDNADSLLVCSPEYVFSIPSGLKNCLEWFVSTTILSEKPVGLITASATGEMAHEEIKLIMKTLGSKFNEDTTLLIQGIKGKLDANGQVIDQVAMREIKNFVLHYLELIKH